MRVTDPEVKDPTSRGSGWGTAVGIIMVILGIVAIARPLYATIASTIAFGWLFILAGVAQIVYAFQSRGAGQLVWKLLVGILYLIAGIYMVSSPLDGALTLTLVLGVTIFVQGVLQVIMAFQIRPAYSWGWVLTSGILGIILGIFIWSRFPFDALWLLGFWVGVSLLCNGIWIFGLSLPARPALR